MRQRTFFVQDAGTVLRMTAALDTDPLEQVRAAIIKAAEACFRRYGLAKTTMEDVAKAASMSRATVYRHFSDRDALVTEVVVRHARAAMEPTRAYLGKFRKFSDKLVEGVLYNVRLGLGDPVMEHLNALGFSGRYLALEGTAVQLTYELWEPILSKAKEKGQMRPDLDLHDAAAWLAQVTWMLVSQSEGAPLDRDTQERLLHTFLVPAFLP